MRTYTTENACVECYDNIYEFENNISTRPLNSVFGGEYTSEDSKRDDIKYKQFSNTKTYDEASAIFRDGYKVGLKELDCDEVKVAPKEINKPQLSVVGYAPHVPNFIAGNPYNMFRSVRQPTKNKVVNIYFDKGAPSRVDAERLLMAGKRLLFAINSLESEGYRVNLYMTSINFADLRNSKAYCLTMKVKDAGAKFNLMKLSYPLVHPSFLRRHIFRWIETCPLIDNSKMRHTYGYSLSVKYSSDKERKRFLVDNRIMGPNDHYVDYQTIINTTKEDLFKLFKQ